MDSKDDIKTDVDNLGMCLGKRLGRLEVSGVEMLEQLVEFVERCGVVEEALVEEHVARDADKMRIERLEEMVSKLNKVAGKIEEEKTGENIGLKKKLAKLEDEQLEAKKNFLEVVESCERMEKKIKEIERINENLVEEVKDLQKDKETLMTSCNNSKLMNSSPTTTTSPFKLQSNISSLLTSIPASQSSSPSAPLAKSAPPLVTVARRGPPPFPLFQPMPPTPLFCPPNYSHHPYSFPQYQDYTGYPQYPWSGEQ
eukprot:GFUD01024317.1.p1 GENE.GFUD01024317.1~~GFUD01024317.1.p1  ORF type:complete len:255 (-),score=88.02 GFUD01024317.1:183-947(-)